MWTRRAIGSAASRPFGGHGRGGVAVVEEGVDDDNDEGRKDLRNKPKVGGRGWSTDSGERRRRELTSGATLRGPRHGTSGAVGGQMQIGVTEDTMTIALAVLRDLLWDQECALVFLPGLQEITAMMDLLSDPSVRAQSTACDLESHVPRPWGREPALTTAAMLTPRDGRSAPCDQPVSRAKCSSCTRYLPKKSRTKR